MVVAHANERRRAPSLDVLKASNELIESRDQPIDPRTGINFAPGFLELRPSHDQVPRYQGAPLRLIRNAVTMVIPNGIVMGDIRRHLWRRGLLIALLSENRHRSNCSHHYQDHRYCSTIHHQPPWSMAVSSEDRGCRPALYLCSIENPVDTHRIHCPRWTGGSRGSRPRECTPKADHPPGERSRGPMPVELPIFEKIPC